MFKQHHFSSVDRTQVLNSTHTIETNIGDYIPCHLPNSNFSFFTELCVDPISIEL